MKKSLFSLIILLAMAVIGCSRGDFTVPAGDSTQIGRIDRLPVGVTDRLPNGSPSGGMGSLGLFSLHIDSAQLDADLAPIRIGASTDVLESVDITNFLQFAPCTNCVKIKSVALDPDGNIVVSIGIKHPFAAGDLYKPITGRNRADLHVFNVEGIVISQALGSSFPGTGETVSGLNLVNADGYSGYLDESLDTFYATDATIHPYVLHFDDYSAGNFNPANPMGFASVTDPPPSGNLVMAMGCDYDYRDYIFALTGSVDLIYAVGCTYALSATSKSQRFNPEYRVPQHNKKAASEVSVAITSNNLQGGDPASTAELEIHVVDISQAVAVGAGLDQMLADSSVKNIYVEVPGVITSPMVIDGSTSISGTGHSSSDPLVYKATITNSASAGEGTYVGLVKVLDNYAPGQNTIPMLNGMDGIHRVPPGVVPTDGLFAITEFAAYQVFQLPIATLCGPITGSITSPTCPVTGLTNNATVNFTVQASSANGGNPITLYEVDYDYNSTTFSADVSNTTGIFNNVGPFLVPDPCESNVPRRFVVAFRATDSCPVPNHTIFATCEVTVTTCFQWKNIPLRPGVKPNDLAVTPQGDLLIVYEDGQVWKYYESSKFQHTAALNLFTAEVVQWSSLTPPPTPVLANGFIDVSDAGNIFASNKDGATCIVNPVRIGYWPAQSFSSTGTQLGEAPSHCTGGPITEAFCYKSGSGMWANDHVIMAPGNGGGQSNMYQQYDGSWGWKQDYGQNCHGLGYDKIMNIYVVGAESYSGDQFWALEDIPDYYCARFIQSDIWNYLYDNSYFGTGIKTDADTCWNEAKDLTMDSRSNLYVLDKLLNGKGRVKGFTGNATGGSPLGHFDVPDQYSSNPLRIEGSTVTGAYGNLIFILHGNTTPGYFLSVFLPAEIPW